MATDLIEVDSERPYDQAIERAAAMIRKGGIVAIPTDALYSLVCDPLNLHAVGRMYQAKGRETNRSLPLLVSGIAMAEELTTIGLDDQLSSRFSLLARRFWPGPLTMIVQAAANVPLKVTGNTGRLALRAPNAAVPKALLEKLGQPLIATSANLSGMPTCASGIEAFGMLDGRVDLVLDGGTATGQGATTVDLTEPFWRVIKEGAIAEADIAEILHGA